ncbi:MAG: Re/Si-specific NAD(P)(+) transhydrogenase subunit alpha [Cytophagales bacterium]|nr:Re/Si-specific NAD(P)(+) transhydrogenase subunit alpha [Cytophagales bacterium]MDW8385111.1 Re/Si-specific NAD(P)(+) transhydrogenase subunit alpha [Flammeovirgaceae bacterium]
MFIGVIHEPQDARVALVPEVVKQLISLKYNVLIEEDAGRRAYFSDEEYQNAGAKITNQDEVLQQADILITLHPLNNTQLYSLKKSALLITLLQPYFDIHATELVAKAGISAVSLDMIPRTTLAQSMDVLSSMASIAGYKAVLTAAQYLPRYFPMLTTAAGSIPPAKVLVLGAGVAGLQAIATAKRLGAKVEAFDTRAASRDEVQSLGAKFVEVEGARDDKSAGGYAVEQTEEYQKRQRQLIHQHASKSDVVICTAQIRGKRAPILLTQETVEAMKPGSVIVDIAASTGGNCELTENNAVITHRSVTIVGNSNLASEMPQHASQLFARNLFNFLKMFTDKEGNFVYDLNNEILKSSLVVRSGEMLYKK